MLRAFTDNTYTKECGPLEQKWAWCKACEDNVFARVCLDKKSHFVHKKGSDCDGIVRSIENDPSHEPIPRKKYDSPWQAEEEPCRPPYYFPNGITRIEYIDNINHVHRIYDDPNVIWSVDYSQLAVSFVELYWHKGGCEYPHWDATAGYFTHKWNDAYKRCMKDVRNVIIKHGPALIYEARKTHDSGYGRGEKFHRNRLWRIYCTKFR